MRSADVGNVVPMPRLHSNDSSGDVVDRMAADLIDPLATANQLEASIALAEWQRQRHLPPAERIVGAHHADVGFEATLDIVAAEMARAS